MRREPPASVRTSGRGAGQERAAGGASPGARQKLDHAGTIRVGISGWTYAGWRGRFYPRGLAQSAELAYASREMDTIEINGTHYSLQRPQSFARWHDETPEDFVFAVKGSRFITHLKQLRNIETPLANFFASGVLRLEEKLGPFLWQFSPRMRFDRERFEYFLSLLPVIATRLRLLPSATIIGSPAAPRPAPGCG
jgi:uncharacterized protein YecE (DUF72 family)